MTNTKQTNATRSNNPMRARSVLTLKRERLRTLTANQLQSIVGCGRKFTRACPGVVAGDTDASAAP